MSHKDFMRFPPTAVYTSSKHLIDASGLNLERAFQKFLRIIGWAGLSKEIVSFKVVTFK